MSGERYSCIICFHVGTYVAYTPSNKIFSLFLRKNIKGWSAVKSFGNNALSATISNSEKLKHIFGHEIIILRTSPIYYIHLFSSIVSRYSHLMLSVR